MSVNFDKNYFKCWVCDARGKNIYRIVRKFGTYDQRQKWLQLDGRLDLSEFDKNLALIKEEMLMTREEVSIIKDAIGEQVDFMRDTKHDLRADLVRMEKILDKVENDIDKVEDEAQALMDRTKKEGRIMINDANNRFNDKIDGMEGYVKRELTNLESELNNKLTKALDNPLANR